MSYIIKWDEIHVSIFKSYIKSLNKIQIKYFILRNYEGLPFVNTSKDIDIIIDPGSYKKAISILLETLRNHDISNYRIVKFERARCCYAMCVNKNFSIHIDLINGYLSKGFEIFPFDTLYKETVKHKDFRVLDKEFDALMLLYYKIIGTRQLKDSYQERISSIYQEKYERINHEIKSTLGKKIGCQLISSLQKKDYQDIISKAKEISISSKSIAFKKKPLMTIINIVRFYLEKIYRIIICPRHFQNTIAVEGADGTGKSTFIDGLTKAIGYYYNSDASKCNVVHFRPTILPNLGAVGEKAGVMKQDTDFTRPHRNKPAGAVSSLFRILYYWLDYVIGIPLVLRKSVQFDNFLIFDRYFYDFLIDPFRARIKLPYWIRKILSKLIIQPRIVFVLLTDPEIIYKRKQELSLEEIKRQLIEFKKLADSNKRFYVIDAGKSPEDMVTQAMEIILNQFTKKL